MLPYLLLLEQSENLNLENEKDQCERYYFSSNKWLINIATFESTLSSKVELAVNSDNASPKEVKLELVFDSFDSSNDESNEVVSIDPSPGP